jgi:hypothetical protein
VRLTLDKRRKRERERDKAELKGEAKTLQPENVLVKGQSHRFTKVVLEVLDDAARKANSSVFSWYGHKDQLLLTTCILCNVTGELFLLNKGVDQMRAPFQVES